MSRDTANIHWKDAQKPTLQIHRVGSLERTEDSEWFTIDDDDQQILAYVRCADVDYIEFT